MRSSAMFDRRLVNLGSIDSDADLESGGTSRWQPLTTVSGDLVERVAVARRDSTEDFFDNVEVSKLITELEGKYAQQEEKLALSSSPETSSNKSQWISQSVTSPKHQGSSGNVKKVQQQQQILAFSAGRKGSNGESNERATAQKSEKRNRFASASKSSFKNSFEAQSATSELNRGDSNIALHRTESNRESTKERKGSFYSEFLESVMSEIEDNQNFLDNEMLQKSAGDFSHQPLRSPRTPLSKVVSSNLSQMKKFSHSAHVQKSTIGSVFTFQQSPKQPVVQSNVTKSSSAKKQAPVSRWSPAAEDAQRNFYLNQFADHEDDDVEDQHLMHQDRRASLNRNIFINYSRNNSSRDQELSCNDLEDDDVDHEAIIGHPTVQALLSEEKGKRWALLKSLYEREASLEKQILDLQKQLKEQTSLSNHFKRMQQELAMSQSEKENVWEKERNKLMDKLRSGHNKMKMLSKLIVLLQREVKEKDEQISGFLDQNKNEVFKYQVLSDEPNNVNLANYLTPMSSVKATNQSDVSKNASQSDLRTVNESKALIDEDLEGTTSISDNQTFCSPSQKTAHAFWNGQALTTEMSNVKKLVTSCKLNAEKQCRMLKHIFPEAAKKSCPNKKGAARGKQALKGDRKKLALDELDFGSNGDAESENEANDSDENADIDHDHYKVYKSKSFSASLGLDRFSSQQPQPSSYLSSHISSSVSAISSTLAGNSDQNVTQGYAGSMNQPSRAPSGDPFDLDLKVKYCSSENLPHVIQRCSLTSPLISPCSSFDDGLSSPQKSKSSSIFGSSIIVNSVGAQCNQTSPTRKQTLVLNHQLSASSNGMDSPLRELGSGGSTTGISLETRGDSRSSGFLVATGRSEDHTVEHENASGSSNGRDDSLMLFDTAPENLSQAALVIRDFDPLDLDI